MTERFFIYGYGKRESKKYNCHSNNLGDTYDKLMSPSIQDAGTKNCKFSHCLFTTTTGTVATTKQSPSSNASYANSNSNSNNNSNSNSSMYNIDTSVDASVIGSGGGKKIDHTMLDTLGVPLLFEGQEILANKLIAESKQSESKNTDSDNNGNNSMNDNNDINVIQTDSNTSTNTVSDDEDTLEEKAEFLDDAKISPPGPDEIQCSNCHRWIAPMSYTTHEIHCARQYIKCKYCDEMVRRGNDVENEHFIDYHKKLDCICGITFDGNKKLTKHSRNECVFRKIICHFCKNELTAIDYNNHKEKCKIEFVECAKCKRECQRQNLKTHDCGKQCPLCDKFVNSNDLVLHLVTNCSERRAICPYCKVLLKTDSMKEHIHYCGGRSQQCDTCNEYVTLANMSKHKESNCIQYSNKQLSKSQKMKAQNGQKLKNKNKNSSSKDNVSDIINDLNEMHCINFQSYCVDRLVSWLEKNIDTDDSSRFCVDNYNAIARISRVVKNISSIFNIMINGGSIFTSNPDMDYVFVNVNSARTKDHIDLALAVVSKLAKNCPSASQSCYGYGYEYDYYDIYSYDLIYCYLNQMRRILDGICCSKNKFDNKYINDMLINNSKITIGIMTGNVRARYSALLASLARVYVKSTKKNSSDYTVYSSIRNELCYQIASLWTTKYESCWNEWWLELQELEGKYNTILDFIIDCLDEMTPCTCYGFVNFWLTYFNKTQKSNCKIRFESIWPQLCESLIKQCRYQTKNGETYEMNEMINDIMMYYDEEYAIIRKKCGSVFQYIYSQLDEDELQRFDKVFIEKFEKYCSSTNSWVCYTFINGFVCCC